MTDSTNRQFKTMKSIVYDELRRSIVSNKFPPGHRLVTGELASQLGVSRMPVRDALLQLEAEGLVRITPHRGAEVTNLSTEEIIELYHIRGALDSLATRLATPNLTQEDKERLQVLLEELGIGVMDNNLERLVNANHEFHALIWKASQSIRLCEMLESLYAASQRFRQVSLQVPGRLDQIRDEHARIAQAMFDGDAKLASHYAEEHHEGTARYLLNFLHDSKPK